MNAESKGRLTLAGALDFARRLPHGAETLVRGVRAQVGKLATLSAAGAGLFAGLGAAHAENIDPRYLQIDPAADRFLAGPSMGGLFDQAAPSDDGFVPALAYSTKPGGGRIDHGNDRVTLRPPTPTPTKRINATARPVRDMARMTPSYVSRASSFEIAGGDSIERNVTGVFFTAMQELDMLAHTHHNAKTNITPGELAKWQMQLAASLRRLHVPEADTTRLSSAIANDIAQHSAPQAVVDAVEYQLVTQLERMIVAARTGQPVLMSDDPRGLFGGAGGPAALATRSGRDSPLRSGAAKSWQPASGGSDNRDLDIANVAFHAINAAKTLPDGARYFGVSYAHKKDPTGTKKYDVLVVGDVARFYPAGTKLTGTKADDKKIVTWAPLTKLFFSQKIGSGGVGAPTAFAHTEYKNTLSQQPVQMAALPDDHRSTLTDANNDIGRLPYLTTHTQSGRLVTMKARAEGGVTVTGAAAFAKTLEPTSMEVAMLPPVRAVAVPQMRGDFQFANGRIDLSPGDAANLDDFYKRWHEANPHRALLLKELLPFEQQLIDKSLEFAPTCGVEALRNSVIERVYAERLLGRYVAGKTSGDVMGVHDLTQTKVGDQLVDIVPKAWNRAKDVRTYTDKGGYFKVANVIVMQPSKETGGRWHVWVERDGMRDATAISEINGSGHTTFLNYDVRWSEDGAVLYEGNRGRRPYRADFKLANLAACAVPAAVAPKVAPPPTPAPAPVVRAAAEPAPACRLTEHPLAVSADAFTTRIREIPELAALPQEHIDAVRALLASHDADLARAEMDAVRGYLLAEYATPSSAFELKNNLDTIFTWIHGNQSSLASTNRLHRDLQTALADPRFKLEKPSQIEIIFAANRTESLRRLGAFYHVHEYIREHESPAAAEQFVLNFLKGTLDWDQIATVTGALVAEEQAKIAALPSIASVNQPVEGTVPVSGALAPRYFDWLRAAAADYQLALRGSDNAGHNGVGSINDLTNDTPQGERVRGWLRDIAEQHRVRFFDDLRNKHPDLADNPALTAHLSRAFDLATQALLAQPQLLERGDWGFMDLFFRSFTSGPINALIGGQNAPSDSQTGRYQDRRVDRPALALAADTSLLGYQMGSGTQIEYLPGDMLSQKTNRFTVSHEKDGQRVAMGTGETRDGIIAERVLNSCDLPPSAAFIGELHSRAAGDQIVDFLLPKWEWLRDISDEEFTAAQVAGIFPRELNGQTITIEYLRRHAAGETARLTRLVDVKFGGATSAVINFEQLDNPLLGLLERYGAWKLAQHGKDHWFKGDDPQPPPPPKTSPLAEVGGGGGIDVTPPSVPVAPIPLD